jgi:hypothetical protein
MKPTDFDWQTGQVVFWDLDEVTDSIPAASRKEDLAQVTFGARTLLDVGFYPEGASDGEFVVCVVRDGDWEAPVLRLTSQTAAGLPHTMRAAVLFAVDLQRVDEGVVTLSLSRSEALVCFEWLHGLAGRSAAQMGPSAEDIVRWDLEAQIERTLSEPFASDYQEQLARAREAVRTSRRRDP